MTQGQVLLAALMEFPRDILLLRSYADFKEETWPGGSRWKALDYPPGGHKYFYDLWTPPDRDRLPHHDYWIALADNSGKTPDLTDDGILYLDRRKPIKGAPWEGLWVPIVQLEGTTSVTVANTEELTWLVARVGMARDF